MCRKVLIFLLILFLGGSVQCLFYSLAQCQNYLSDYLNNKHCKFYGAQCKSVNDQNEIFCESSRREYEVLFRLDWNKYTRPFFNENIGFDLHDTNITCVQVFNVYVNTTVKYVTSNGSQSVAVFDKYQREFESKESINFYYEFKKDVELFALAMKRKPLEYLEIQDLFKLQMMKKRTKIYSVDADMIDYKICDLQSQSTIEANSLDMPPKNGTLLMLHMSCSKDTKWKYEKLLPWLTISAPGIARLRLVGCDFFSKKDMIVMPELTYLCLINIAVFKIEEKTFDLLPKLEVLHVTFSPLITVDDIFIYRFEHLREVDISGSGMTFLPLHNQTTIQVLRATHLLCNDCSLCRDGLVHYECTDDYRDEYLTKFIPKLVKLASVDLSYNALTRIPSTTFENLAANGVVILKNNKIETRELLQFRNLSLLDLSRNFIKSLEEMQISGEISYLNLADNQIKSWVSSDIFNSDKVQLKHLNISYNQITAFDETMLKSLSTLESVDIGGNLLDCNDCSLGELQLWLNSEEKTQVTNLGRSYKTLLCMNPAELLGKLLLDAPLNEVCTSKQLLIVWISIPIPIILFIFGLLIYVYRFQLLYITHMIQVGNRAKNKVPEKNFVYNAFLSYSGDDRSWVHDVLLKTLESDENKYKLCVHERDFRLGALIMDNVYECIERSRNVILVLSPNFVSSKWCQEELRMVQELMFVNNPDFLILVELEKLRRKDLPSTLRLLMSTRTYLECPHAGAEMSNFWRRLKQVLGRPIDATATFLEEDLRPDIRTEDIYQMYQLGLNEIRAELHQEQTN